MRFVDEFRSADLARPSRADRELAEPGRHYKLMEVCGGHTHAIYKHGVEDLLPDEIELVRAGCPVCVIPMGRQDDDRDRRAPEVIFTTFGDMMRVPASNGSLLDAKANGADVRMVYSPLDALKIARENPDREVVFFAIGFETTAPSTALTVLRARQEDPELLAVLQPRHDHPGDPRDPRFPDLRLDGFVGPGHVSTVIGLRPYRFIAADYGKPVVCSGFEPLDVPRACT